MFASPLLPIFLIVMVDVLGLTIILPLLPFYAERLGASPTQVGLLVSTFAVCQLVAGPILGQLSDRFGRKPLLLVSQLGTFAGFLLLAAAPSLMWVFVARAIDGATAGNLSIAQAYIADVTEPKNRSRAFALIGIAFGLGFLAGPAISGFLSGYGYHVPILAAAGLSLTSIACTALLLPKGAPAHAESMDAGPAGRRVALLSWSRYSEYFKRPVLRQRLLQFFIFAFGFAMFTSGFALFAERTYTWEGRPYDAQHVGYLFAYAGFVGLVVQGGLIGRLARGVGEPRLVAVGFACMAVGYGALSVSHATTALVIATTIASFGSSVVRPVLTSLVTQVVDRHEQGLVLGLTQSLTSIAQITAPLLGGVLIDHAHLDAWAVCIATVAFGGMLVLPLKAGATVQASS